MKCGIRIGFLVMAILIGVMAPEGLAGQHELPLSSGATWRGSDGDTVTVVFKEQGVEQTMTGDLEKIDGNAGFEIIVIRGELAGSIRSKAIFGPDIVSMTTVSAGAPVDASSDSSVSVDSSSSSSKGKAMRPSNYQGVFYLPWEGMVGVGARHDEIVKIGEQADELGEGQIIVLHIKSGGGLVLEGDRIHDALKDLRKRHRVVAWVKEAISAAAYTALHCNEIYFMRNGAMGSIVMFAGQTAISGAELQAWIQQLAEVAELGDRSPIPAECMVTRTKMASYDKDPDTGKVTWYADMSGEYDISDAANVLTLNADNAFHSGYIDGIADNKNDLALEMGLPGWKEIGTGQKVFDDWQKRTKMAKEQLTKLQARLGYKGSSTGDARSQLATRISLLEEILRWADRCPPVYTYEMGFPPKDVLERQLRELKKQLGDMNRRR
jgi:hypothetical protein